MDQQFRELLRAYSQEPSDFLAHKIVASMLRQGNSSLQEQVIDLLPVLSYGQFMRWIIDTYGMTEKLICSAADPTAEVTMAQIILDSAISPTCRARFDLEHNALALWPLTDSASQKSSRESYFAIELFDSRYGITYAYHVNDHVIYIDEENPETFSAAAIAQLRRVGMNPQTNADFISGGLNLPGEPMPPNNLQASIRLFNQVLTQLDLV